ncbi:MAG TPA: YidB family protein [Acetobacteraceae bacterium]|nr:YidB family protein [Acetobacteraceae bacterium]
MSLLGNLSEKLTGLLGSSGDQAAPQALSGLLSAGGVGGLAGIVSKLQQAGLNEQVSSWLGSGANLPITADQLRTVLGESVVQQMAAKFGLPLDGVLSLLAQHLPAAVDKASPDGTLQPEADAPPGDTPAPPSAESP